MARIRTIKPEVLSDPKASRLSHSAWRLWVSMWTLADDAGNLPGDPAWLSAQIFWAQSADIELALAELKGAGFIRPYYMDGEWLLHIGGWEKHQKIDRPSGGKFKSPDEQAFLVGSSYPREPSRAIDEPSMVTREGSCKDHDLDHDLDRTLSRAHEYRVEEFGLKQFDAMWREVTAKTPTGDAYAMRDGAARICESAKLNGATPGEWAKKLVRAFMSRRDAWQKEKRPLPALTVEAFLSPKHFATAEEIARGEIKAGDIALRDNPSTTQYPTPVRTGNIPNAEETAAHLAHYEKLKETAVPPPPEFLALLKR